MVAKQWLSWKREEWELNLMWFIEFFFSQGDLGWKRCLSWKREAWELNLMWFIEFFFSQGDLGWKRERIGIEVINYFVVNQKLILFQVGIDLETSYKYGALTFLAKTIQPSDCSH